MNIAEPEIYIQPDYPAGLATSWVVIGASVQGSGHIRAGTPCQDTHAHQIINNSRLIAVVADGLGSAERSDVGSRLAAAAAVEFLRQRLLGPGPNNEQAWIEIMRQCFQSARARLEIEAAQNQIPLRVYATTLIAVVLDGDWLACAQIGDGAVVASLQTGQLELVSAPQNEEYVNVTYPLTMPEMESAAQFLAWQADFKAIAMMTDGVQHISIRSADGLPHGPFFEPLFRQLPGVKDWQKASQSLADFMASAQICAKTDDDKTLLLIGKR